MNKSFIALVVGLTLSAGSFANDKESALQTISHSDAFDTHTGPFIRADLGRSFYLDACNSSDDCVDTRTTWGLSVGYFFTQEWGFELGYFNLDDYQWSDSSTDNYLIEEIETLDTQAIYRHTFNNMWSLDGKIGAGYWRSNSIGRSDGYHQIGDHSGIYPKAGVALNWHIAPKWVVSSEYTHRFNVSGETRVASQSSIDIGTLYIGLTYQLGKQHSQTVIERQTIIGQPASLSDDMPSVTYHHVIDSTSVELFESGSARITHKQSLDELIAQLHTIEFQYITVIGHTDDQGSREINERLSKQRAQAVANYISKEGEIEQNRITPVGMASAQPIDDNSTESGRAKNRRVEIFVR